MSSCTLLIVAGLLGALVSATRISDHGFRADCDQRNGTCVYTLRVRAGVGARDLAWFNATVRSLVGRLNAQRSVLSGLRNASAELQRQTAAAERRLASQHAAIDAVAAERNSSLTLIGRLDALLAKLDSQLAAALACRHQPCLNSGVCVADKASVHCVCRPGFTGPRCETAERPCASSPCLHAGRCTDLNSTAFRCACPLGFHGPRCQHALRDDSSCAANPCLHGAACRNTACGPRCVCPAGFRGRRCEQSTACDHRPCGPHGDCAVAPNSPAGFVCRCRGRWSGRFCDLFGDAAPSGCGSARYRSGNGSLASHPAYDGRSVYPDARRCLWTVTAHGEHGRVCLQFGRVDLRAGKDWDSHDHVAVYDNASGSGVPLIRFLPWENHERFCSRTPQISLRFTATKRASTPTRGTGFRIKYSTHCAARL